jgi:hypothetical protein
LNESHGRVFHVRLPDPLLTVDEIKGWSKSIETALFPKPIEPRTFLLVLKPDVKDVKKEIESLKKAKFNGKPIEIEEKRESVSTDETKSTADLIDPYTLYVTNLDESVGKTEVRELFPTAKTVLNPRKHNPRVSGGGSGTKFCFVSFATAEEALSAFKGNFNKVFKGGKGVVLRFRRVSKSEAAQAKAEAKKGDVAVVKSDVKKEVVAKKEAASPAKKAKQAKPIKEEPKDDDDEDDDDDDEDEEEMDVS